MDLPKDPMMLYSVVNTKLRDYYSSLEVMCEDMDISREELESIINRAVMRIVAALSELGFYMDSNQVATAVRNAQAANDTRYNTVEVR